MSDVTYTAACVILLYTNIYTKKKAQDVDDAGYQEAAFFHPPMWVKKNKNLKILYPSMKMHSRQSACSKTATLFHSWLTSMLSFLLK